MHQKILCWPKPIIQLLTDPRELRTRFAVSHVLDLRLQRTDNLFTADAALIETRGGLQIWAQRFETVDGPGEQETLLYKMICRIESRLMQAMVADMQLPDGGCAYAHASLLKAIGLLALRGWNRATFKEATGLIERSIALEPGFGPVICLSRAGEGAGASGWLVAP